MTSYKVSYKILRQQGDDMKAVAKLVDGYSERIAQVSGRLGEGDLLAQVRTNLGKLREQLGESRTVLNTAGEFLTKTVDSYTGVELRQVKKTDGTRAHNRDFYKNPVAVASVGGAGVAASMPSPAAPAGTYVDNSVNVNYVAVESAPITATPEVASTAAAHAPTAVAASAPAAASAAEVGGTAGIAAGVGALGAGAVMGVKRVMNQDKETKAASPKNEKQDVAEGEYDPEAALAKAMARVKELEDEDV